MPRIKKAKVVEKVVEEPKNDIAPKVEFEDVKKIVPEEKKSAGPEATGKFYVLQVSGGAVVVNPNGQIVSKPVSQVEAETLVRRFQR